MLAFARSIKDASGVACSLLTVMEHWADKPLSVDTVMVAVPLLIPVTTPEEDTVATDFLSELHVYVVTASDGVRDGVSAMLSPIFNSFEDGSDITSGLTVAATTVTRQYGALAEILE